MTLSSSFTRLAVGAIAAAGLWFSAADVTRAQELSTMNLNVDEGGFNTYSISLDTQPTGTVTITPVVVPTYAGFNIPTFGVTVSGAVTFTTTDWETPRAITVTAADNDDTGDITVTIAHTVDGYGSIVSTGDVVVTVIDNDSGNDIAPTFGSIAPPRQLYAPGIDTPTLILPAANGGNKPLSYTLTPVADIPAGLTVDTTARTLAGTPTAMAAAVTLTWTVTDTDTNTADSDQDMLSVILDVQADTAPNFVAMVAAQNYLQHVATALTLPEANGGNGALSYALIGDIPAGLAFNLDTRVLAGIPTTAAAATTLTWTVADADTNTANSDTASLNVAITITANSSPSFDATPVADRTYISGQAIDPLTLPVAVGNNGPFNYALTGTLPAGLAYTDATRTIAGTPTAAASTMTLTWGATDSGSRTTTLTFTITVHPTNVCFRTPAIRDYIVGLISGVTSCDAVTTANFPTIADSVSFQNTSIPVIRSGDFDGFSAQITSFTLNNVGLTTVPADMLSGLAGLTTVSITNNDTLTTLPPGLFDGLNQLQTLNLNDNGLVTLPARLFNNLGSLQEVRLHNNRLRTLPAPLFVNLPLLRSDLRLDLNLITTLPSGIFDGIGSGGNAGLNIHLQQNPLKTLSSGVFRGLGNRVGTLLLNRGQIERLPEGLFDGLTHLTLLSLLANPSSDFPLEVKIVEDESGMSRASLREAAPFRVNFEVSGSGDTTVSSFIPAGSRMSEPLGTSIILRSVTWHGTTSRVCPQTQCNGIDLRLAADGVVVFPRTLTVREGNQGTYEVALGTAPTGDVTVTYSISPDDDTHDLTVVSSSALTFTPANWHLEQRVTVTVGVDQDRDNETVILTYTGNGYPTPDDDARNAITITIQDTESLPTFDAMATVDDQIYQAGMAIEVLTLPAVMGGDGTVTYALDGLPDGLTFDADSREMSGTPTPIDAGVNILTYSATDDDEGRSDNDTVTLTFTVTIITEDRVNLSPTSLTVLEGTDTTSFYTAVLNSVPTGAVTVTPNDDSGKITVSGALTFSTATWNVMQTVTVSAVQDADNINDTTTITHTVTGYGSVTSAAEDVTVTITDRRSAPTFNGATVPHQSYAAEVPIPTLTLPSATAGDSLTYTLTGPIPDGLNFDADALTLTGTPTTMAAAVTLTYTVADLDDDMDDDDEETLMFMVTITRAPRVTIEPTALTVNEGADTLYTVVLDTRPAGDVTVTPTSGDTNKVTVSGALTFSAAAWNTAQTITVTAVDDPDAFDDTITIAHAVTGYGSVTGADPVTVEVEDDDDPGVDISETSLTVSEGNEGSTTIYTVMLVTQPAGDVTVMPTSSATDKVTVSGALTFSTTAWNMAQTITVTAIDDSDGANDTATIAHAVTGYGSVTDADPVTVTVTDNDMPGVEISETSLTVSEASEGSTTIYTVVLATQPASVVTVTPTSGDADKLTVSGALTFSTTAWNTAQTVTVTAGDDQDGANELVTITHAVTGYGSVANADPVTVTVRDDDRPGVEISETSLTASEDSTTIYTIMLATRPASDVTVTPTSGDTDKLTVSGALTFSPEAWNTAQTVTISTHDDPDGIDETVTITHAVTGYGSVTEADPVTVTVTDNDTPGVTLDETALTVGEESTAIYTVELDTQPAGDVTVMPTSGDADKLTVSGALTFSPTAWNTAQTITVSTRDDPDGIDDTITIAHAVTGYGSVANADPVTVAVTDNDTPGVTLDQTALAVDESGDGSTAIYTVVLDTQPAGDVTVTPTSGATDKLTVSGALTFSPTAWDTAQTVTVTAVDDPDGINDTITITHAVTGYGSVTAVDVTVAVTDDDTPGVTLNRNALNMRESSEATYTVVLDTEPAGDVTVVPAVADPAGEVTVSGALTFTTATWNTAQTVTVSADQDADGIDDDATITHTVTGYGSVTAPADDPVTVTVMDTETPGVVLNQNAVSVREGSTTIYTVVLNTAPAGDVTVTPAVADPAGEVTVSGALTFTAATWNTVQTVTVSAGQDADGIDDTATITHTVMGYGSVTAPANDPVTVTVTDPDTPGVTLGQGALDIREGGMTTYTVVLNTEPAGDVTVTPAVADPAGEVTVSGALTFTATTWNTAQTVTVAAGQDADGIGDTATITHTVTGYGGVTAADPVTVAVTDPDTPGVTLDPTALTVAEGNMTTYTVMLDTEPAGDVTVTPAVAAPAGEVTVSGALTFAPATWNTAQTVTVAAGQDDDGIDDTATITHTVTGYGSVEDAADVTVTVTDTNMPGVTLDQTALTVAEGSTTVYTVVLDTEPAGDVVVTPAVADPAGEVAVSGALTFAPATWNTMQTVTVTADRDADGIDDTATLTHTVTGYGSVTAADIPVAVTDVNTPGVTLDQTALTMAEGDMATYTVVLDTEPAGAVVVTPAVADPAGEVTVSGALTFAPTTWNTVQTVTVAAGQDDDGIDDTGTLTHTVTGYGSVTAADVPVAVTDDDTPGVTLDQTALTVAEGDMATYTVVLDTEPAGAVVVTPAVAAPAGEVTVSGALTFSMTTWSTVQTVTIAAGQDDDGIDDTATLTHTVTGYGSVTATDVPVAVTDDDTPGVTLDQTALTVAEGDMVTYTVVLDTEPAGAVVVTPAVAAPAGEVTVSGALTFSMATWSTAQTVTVAAADDVDANNDTAAINHVVTGYGGVTAADVTVVVTDNDTPGVILGATALTMDEGAAAVYTVVLATLPDGRVTVTPAVMSPDSGVTVSGALVFEPAAWNMPMSVTVRASVDADAADDTAIIAHTIAGYGSVTVTDVTVTVTDTDSVPEFGLATVADQVYTVATVIPTLTLPEVIGGDDPLSYTLTPGDAIPAGLTHDAEAFTLTGTPTVPGVVTLTWTATDRDADTAVLTFTVMVEDDENAIRAGLSELSHVVLPEVARALADQRVGAIARRIRQSRDTAGDRSLTIGGQSTLAGVVATHGKAIAGGNFDLKTLLGGSDFVLPLDTQGVGPAALSGVTLWGGGDYRALSGKNSALDWEGNLFSGHVGADIQVNDETLAGVAVSWGRANLGYNNPTDDRIGLRGDYEVGITTVHPYVGWTAMGGRLDLWATAGYGWGELEIESDDEEVGQSTSDVTMQTIGAGGSGNILEHGGTTVRLKGEALHTSMDVDGGDRIVSHMVEARRARLGVEVAHTHVLAGGERFVPSIEVGMRHDAGDGRTGTGAEVGSGFQYVDVARGLTVEGRGRVLVGHSGDYKDWGLGGSIRLETGSGGRGLSLSLHPRWGAVASRVDQLWAQEAVVTVPASGAPVQRNGQMDLDVGYGVAWDELLVTPYGRFTVTNSPARTYRVGGRMLIGSGMTLNVEGIREETAARLVNQGVRLRFGLGLSNGMRLNVEGMRQQNAAEALNHGIKLQIGLDF